MGKTRRRRKKKSLLRNKNKKKMSSSLENKFAELSTEEEATVKKMFSSWDANNDGVLDLQEAHAKFGSKGVNFINDCDTLKKDGKVDIDELKAFFKKLKGNLKQEE